MSLIHQLTNLLVVALVQCVADCQYAVLLTENELSALVVLFAYLGTNLIQLLPCAVAQGLELAFGVLSLNVLHHVLARVAAVIVGRASKLVLHHAIEQHEAVAIGFEGEILELTAAAVQTHQATSLTEY